MHRFYLPPAACQSPTLSLTKAEAHHALHVLRVRIPEPAVVLDGAGNEYRCAVTGTGRNHVTLAIRERLAHAQPAPGLTLVQAVTKSRSMESIVQKATELGAQRIVPLITERSVPQYGAADAARKAERWRDIAIEALKQCATPWLPTIDPPLALREFLARHEPFELMLLASLEPGAQPTRTVLAGERLRQPGGPATVAVWIGPEGDFSAGEAEAIRAAGARPITLGPLTLRSETAAIYCLSVLRYEFLACASSQSQAGGNT
jgi:16S rRNA (uracil1498-N3)-methyltransferase